MIKYFKRELRQHGQEDIMYNIKIEKKNTCIGTAPFDRWTLIFIGFVSVTNEL